MSMFSMASMTDVIFLLLIFFMVTSTFVFPSALEVNLPQSSEQSAIKPGTRVFIDKEYNIYASVDESEPKPLPADQLMGFLKLVQQNSPKSLWRYMPTRRCLTARLWTFSTKVRVAD